MSTLTFKATEEQINEVLQPLSFILHNSQQSKFLKTAIRSNLNNLLFETRVYIVNVDNYEFDTNPIEWDNEKFISEAEIQGTVYSLQGFADNFNSSESISSFTDVIRII